MGDRVFVLTKAAKGIVDILDPKDSNILAVSTDGIMILDKARDLLRNAGVTDTGDWEYSILIFDNHSGAFIKSLVVDRNTPPQALGYFPVVF